jgi:hypothetical protein
MLKIKAILLCLEKASSIGQREYYLESIQESKGQRKESSGLSREVWEIGRQFQTLYP